MGFKEIGNEGKPWSADDRMFCHSRIEKLVLECTEGNHYKYYHLSQPEANSPVFTVKYGRIGSTQTTHTYAHPKTMFDQFLSKINKKGGKASYQLQSYKFFGERSSSYEEFMQKMGADAELFD